MPSVLRWYPMKYRKLGETQLQVSEISFGTIPVLRGNVPVLPEYYNLDEKAAIQVMEHAFHLGCNLFDTAIVPEYGDAEIKLGRFAAHIGRDKIIISDKARFFDGFDMYNAVLQSCEHLDTHPDIYFVHQVDEENQDVTFGKYGAVDALHELKKEGRIRFVGVATHYYDILLRGAKDKRVDVLQGSGNILERGMLDRLAAQPLFRHKGFLLNKVYAAGILPHFFPVETLISGVLSYPITTAVIGLGTEAQIDQAIGTKAFDYRRPSFRQVLSVLERSYAPIPCDRCQRCRCIYGTEIHLLFRQYHYYFLGKEYWSLRKFDIGIEESAANCKRCTDMSCMKKCPRQIHIPEMIQRIHRLVQIHVRNSRV